MNTDLGSNNAGMKYSAKDLNDIADTFLKLAEKEGRLSDSAPTKQKMMQHLGASNAYVDCAEILRNTTITG